MTTKEIIEEIKKMTVLDLAALVKALEEEFGVSAAAPVAVAGGGLAAAAAPADEEEEKTEFDVILNRCRREEDSGHQRVRAVTSLGLKEAKDLVDGAPNAVKLAIPKAEAEDLKKQLEEAGASVEIK